MAVTWTNTILSKFSLGPHRCVLGLMAGTGTYAGGDAVTNVAMSDDYFTTTDAQDAAVYWIKTDSGYSPAWNAGTVDIFGGGAAAHTHAVAVTAGTAGGAVTNNAGVLESTGGEDLATNASTAITAASPEVTGAVLAGESFFYIGIEIREILDL